MQDAHEFLNYLLNECSEILEREAKARLAKQPGDAHINGYQDQTSVDSKAKQQNPPTFIHELFQVRWLLTILQ